MMIYPTFVLIRQNILRIMTSKSLNLQIIEIRCFFDYLSEDLSWKFPEESLKEAEIYLYEIESWDHKRT